ncbi:MAG: hypothetical protein PVI66_15385 [Candidatus Aminicenantes bacterium]|jgi:hypothetical protein
MRKTITLLNGVFIFLVFHSLAIAQFSQEELAEREKWEEFLMTAKVIGQKQMKGRHAVTSPWKLELEKNGIARSACWKDCRGIMRGFKENWKWEIASYRLDKYLGLNMIPPTVEKRFKGRRGSCQLWMDDCFDLDYKVENKIPVPQDKVIRWNRAFCLQRAFDNLIANEDRTQRNYLVNEGWCMYLIDHSRSFRTSKKFVKNLIFDENFRQGPEFIMKELPRAFVEKLKSLDTELMKEIVGEYLTKKEIKCTLIRRDLILAWLDNRIKELGEDKVLY